LGNSQFPERILAKIVFFVTKTDFRQKICAKIFARSAAVSPWRNGFISLLLAKSEFCGIFHCIPCKSCKFGRRMLTKWLALSIKITPLKIFWKFFVSLTIQPKYVNPTVSWVFFESIIVASNDELGLASWVNRVNVMPGDVLRDVNHNWKFGPSDAVHPETTFKVKIVKHW
jgi:hypothetical protein